MSAPAQAQFERRVLILAPVGKDASLVEAMLQRDGIACKPCVDDVELARDLERGAAAILVTEEAAADTQGRLAGLIARQPPWSDIPVLLLTRRGADSPVVGRALETLGNVTLLERPVRVGALASAVRSALRARERQYETRAYLEEREQANDRKDMFLATLAHELRNPLAPIRNSLAILRMSAPQPNAEALHEIMERQINHMVRLVDDLMEVSRITRGKIELRRSTVELASILAAAIETSRPLIDGGGHQLTVSLPSEPLVLDADPMRLAQVFANLINNAAKYTDPGGRIAITARREGESAVITVTDNGVGIPAHALNMVFEMFAQAEPANSRSQTGLGIGLTLVRNLVDMHGGNVTAASEGRGRGSQFTVRLPLTARPQVDKANAAIAAPSVRPLPRVLVVDDNRDAADSLGALLQIMGAEVRVAHDGFAALEEFDTFHPGVVVLDLGMPELDGYEVARRIRKRPDSRETLLVALTGWGQEKERLSTKAAGFDHHLIKPVDLDSMKAVLAARAG